MKRTTIRGKIYQDNSGVLTEIPVILTEFGPLMPLVDYFIEKAHVRSQAWMNNLVYVVGLLLDYVTENHDCFDNPKDLFSTFAKRLYTGTAGQNGLDPSGLYWKGHSDKRVAKLVGQLSEFSDWMAKHYGTKPLNPWRTATRSEEILAWGAWHHRRDRSFLGHTWDREKDSLEMTRARNSLLKKNLVIDHESVKYFSEDHIQDLLFNGFIVPGKQNSPRLEERLNLRDILITLLLHYGGLRMSEPFHLFVQDVLSDPLNSERAWVRIYHPRSGTAPLDLLDINGKPTRCNREVYLKNKCGMRPRNEYATTDQLHAGWKNNLLDSNAHYMNVSWFPQWAGELFNKLWLFYMMQRAQIECDHPFAFVTLEGKPYGIDSYKRAHRRAVERIGLKPAKSLGTTPHAHRHAYGQRLTEADVDPIIRKKAFHHQSLESQSVYTEPSRTQLIKALEAAAQRKNDGITPLPPDFLRYGFKDVDPLGLMSGSNPKLLRRK